MANGEVSSVRVARAKDYYTWAVTVAAGDESLEALQVAKERALELSRELEAVLGVFSPVKNPRL